MEMPSTSRKVVKWLRVSIVSRQYRVCLLTSIVPDYGLVCAPSSVHAQVLKLAREVIEAHVKVNGPMPVSK